MSTQLSGGLAPVSPNQSSHSVPACRALRFLGSSAASEMPASTSSSALPMSSALPSQIWSLHCIRDRSRQRNSSGASTHQCPNSSMPTRSWKPSRKPKPQVANATVAPAALAWRVKTHKDILDTIAEFGIHASIFRPTLATLISELQRDPKQFPKKSGNLKDARAAPLRFRGREAWRAVYRIDEDACTVFIVALLPHDAAYAVAVRRL